MDRPLRLFTALVLLLGSAAEAQDRPRPDGPADGPPPGPRAPGPMGGDRKLVKEFDLDHDKRLDKEERAAARAFLKENPSNRPGPRRRGDDEPQSIRPGPVLTPERVDKFPAADLYDTSVLRTIFLEFENADWEAELADFYGTDVEVPATMILDGGLYPNVGVSFRGASSFFMVPAGKKRSFNISIDAFDKEQRLHGVRTLNLLNGNGDASFMSSVLFSHIARQHIPAPEANFVRVAVNGESWGIYVNAEQFNSDFVEKHYGAPEGARWKVSGSPNATSGLHYLGDDVEAYKRKYDMKKGTKEDWRAFIDLCRTVSTTPIEELEARLRPILDLDGVMWFLALDIGLVNSDGYWTRASDYSIYRDPKGVFHIFPHDMNESFSTSLRGPRTAGGPPRDGGSGGPSGDGPPRQRPPGQRRAARPGFALDPLTGLDDDTKPLRSRLLQVPGLRDQYLDNLRTLAGEDLSWENLGPVIAESRALIEADLEADTRKLTSFEAFDQATSPDEPGGDAARPSLRTFIARRAGFLLRHPEIAGSLDDQKLGREGDQEQDP